MELGLYIAVGLCVCFCLAQVVYLSVRNRRRIAQPIQPRPLDRDWRQSVPTRYATPATRHLGHEAVGVEDERRAA